jgi:hypothetical protein
MLNNTTDTETTVRTSTRSPWTDVPVVTRAPKEEIEDGAASIDSDNSVAGAAKRARLKGPAKKNEKSAAALLLMMGGKSSLDSITNVALDERTNSQLSNLTQAVKMIGGVLGTAGFVGFALQSAFVGAELGGDARRTVKNKSLVANSPDAPTKAATESVSRIAAEEGSEAVAKTAGKSFLGKLFKGVGSLFKKIPVIGAVITGGFVVYEVAGFIGKGDLSNAFGAAVAGGAEMAGNIVGFGVGDAARESTRQAFIQAGGAGFEGIAKSDIRSLIEAGQNFKEQFSGSAAMPTAANLTTRPPAYNLALANG